MRRFHKLLAVGALAGAFMIPAIGEAAAAYTTGSVNLRGGPSVRHHKITTIPRGAYVTIHGCISNGWCDVSYRWARGWVSGRYVSSGPRYAPRYYPRYSRPYYPGPYYHSRPSTGFGIWFGW